VHLGKGEQLAATTVGQSARDWCRADHDDGLVLSQSLAIIDWLTRPTRCTALRPTRTSGRACARSRLSRSPATSHRQQPAGAELPVEHPRRDGGAAHGLVQITGSTSGFERWRSASPATRDRTFCHGNRPRLPTFCLVPQSRTPGRFTSTSRLPRDRRTSTPRAPRCRFADAAPRPTDAE